jgi:divalent metal cation (Fe/Co/Zn/Cd) transporter
MPAQAEDAVREEIPDRIRLTAAKSRDIENVHSIRLVRLDQGLQVQMDLEMNPSLSLEEADKIVHNFESEIKQEIKEISSVVTHIESQEEHSVMRESVVERGHGRVIERIRSIALSVPGIKECYDILVTTVGGEMNVTMTCGITAESSVVTAHTLATQVQELVMSKIQATKVIVHTDPVKASSPRKEGKV